MLKNSPSAMSRERSSTAATSPKNFETRSNRTSISLTSTSSPDRAAPDEAGLHGGGDHHMIAPGLNSLQREASFHPLYGLDKRRVLRVPPGGTRRWCPPGGPAVERRPARRSAPARCRPASA